MTVGFELKDFTDRHGLRQLRMVIRDGSKRKYENLPIKLPPSAWDQRLQKVKHSYVHHAVINNVLKLKLAEINTKLAESELTVGKVNVNAIIGREVKKLTFREFAAQCLQQWERKKSEATHKAYRSMLMKVEEFDPSVALDSITPEWLAQYESFSRKECNDAGTLKRIAFVSVILKEAIRQGKAKTDPFLTYRKPPKRNPKREWLTREELERVEAVAGKTNSNIIKRTAYWFLLACYTGLRYSDIVNFDHKKAVREGRLVLYTQKTGEIVSIKITKNIQRLLDITQNLGPVYTNQKTNQYLKSVAHLANIDKKVTFHMARHTFAVQCANRGISQEVASKLLGHSDLKTTSIYYKITNQRLDEEMQKWE